MAVFQMVDVGSIPISRRGYCIKVVLQFCILEVQVQVLISPFGLQARGSHSARLFSTKSLLSRRRVINVLKLPLRALAELKIYYFFILFTNA